MLARIGAVALGRGKEMLYGLGFFARVLKETIFFFRRRSIGYRVLTFQILFTGVEALAIVAILAVGLGAVIIVQGLSLLPQFGQGQLIYRTLIIVITRELGPLLTAFIIVSRSATAIATELGTMVTHHEIEAYVATGIDPIAHLVVPRVIGVSVSLFLLNVYFNLFGLLGSYFVTQLVRPIQFREYFSSLLRELTVVDVSASIVKSLSFGVIISTVATFCGLRVERATTEIPVSAIKAVGRSIVLVILANAVITLLYYL